MSKMLNYYYSAGRNYKLVRYLFYDPYIVSVILYICQLYLVQ